MGGCLAVSFLGKQILKSTTAHTLWKKTFRLNMKVTRLFMCMLDSSLFSSVRLNEFAKFYGVMTKCGSVNHYKTSIFVTKQLLLGRKWSHLMINWTVFHCAKILYMEWPEDAVELQTGIPYARHHNLLLITNSSWILIIHKGRIFWKNLLEKTFWPSKSGFKIYKPRVIMARVRYM